MSCYLCSMFSVVVWIGHLSRVLKFHCEFLEILNITLIMLICRVKPSVCSMLN